MNPRIVWRRQHPVTRRVAITAGAATVLMLAPVVAVVLQMRCCGASRGAEPGAWVVLGVAVLLAGLLNAVIAGAATAGLCRIVERMRRG